MAELIKVTTVDAPPLYSAPIPTLQQVCAEKKQDSCRAWSLWGLVFYAGAITAAIIAVSILAVSKNDNTSCLTKPPPAEDMPTEYEHYHLGDDHADCYLDKGSDKQIIRFTGEEYGENTMAVLDFKKGLAGIHDGTNNTCYLIGGIDSQLPNATQLDKFLREENQESQSKVTVYYLVMDDRPIKNLALLPAELHETCWGEPVYWLERVEHLEGNRQKRGVTGCVKSCVGFGLWGMCLGWKYTGCGSVGC